MSDDEHPELDFDPLDDTRHGLRTTSPQRYRVGPNYLQLPVNQAKAAQCAPTSATDRRPTSSTAPARART